MFMLLTSAFAEEPAWLRCREQVAALDFEDLGIPQSFQRRTHKAGTVATVEPVPEVVLVPQDGWEARITAPGPVTLVLPGAGQRKAESQKALDRLTQDRVDPTFLVEQAAHPPKGALLRDSWTGWPVPDVKLSEEEWRGGPVVVWTRALQSCKPGQALLAASTCDGLPSLFEAVAADEKCGLAGRLDLPLVEAGAVALVQKPSTPAVFEAPEPAPGVTGVHHAGLDVKKRRLVPGPTVARLMARGPENLKCVAVVQIDAKGRPTQVDVQRCDDLLHDAVREAFLEWRWSPPAQGAVQTTLAMVFSR